MKPIKTIEDPEAFKLLADETRRKTVFLLRAKEMSVSQIAADLNITPQAVYHHIKKLLKAGMVEVVREERIDHLIVSYYQATAETFFCTVGKTPRGAKVAKEQITTVLNALKKLGFKIEFDENKISQLVDIRAEFEEGKSSKKFEDKISELDEVDFLTKQTVQDFAETLSMSDEKFAKQQQIHKKFKNFLNSLVKNRK
ncbi:MAG: helix-turn-helix domain-containing protein [Candidatus Bathyarchaeota archaeon]|nr:MAG: helix-turn-helix domain-containing protein [Candidatus Bathyarchaeota archaeon]